MKLKKQILIGIFLSLSIFLFANFTFAQDFGVDVVDSTINLEAGEPREIIGRIINIALSFLGIIILSLMIYAGFLWMTSGGEEEKIRQAKGILKNAIIGLLITLSAWGITVFILNRLYGASMGGGSGSNIPSGRPSLGGNYGLGTMGNCSVESVYPENNQKDVPRNTSVMVTFKETVGLSSVCMDATGSSCACNNGSCSLLKPEVVRIFSEDLGDACGESCPDINTNVTNVSVSVSADQKTLVFTPSAYLGSADKNTNYGVRISSALEKSNGGSMFSSCSTKDLYWGFEVSSKLDLSPPIVVKGGSFPPADNQKDVNSTVSSALSAKAEIFVKDCPSTYKSAELISVSPQAEVDLSYHGLINSFAVVVPADAENKAQLFNASSNALLGVADFDDQDVVNFNGYFALKAENRAVGSRWDLKISPERKADSLTIANEKYIFANSSENNNILVNEGACNTSAQAENIQAKISGHPEINVSREGNKVLLRAKVAGEQGNNISLSSSNSNALELKSFSEGSSAKSSYAIRDKKDVPINTVIKVNFNEAMNPVTLSGPASTVAPYVRVVNASPEALGAANTCSADKDCRSYKCENSSCVGDYLNGSFMLSSAYRTLEFISDIECGINGCGEKVYCLPPSSKLALEIRAADLNICNNDQDCLAFSPYKKCVLGGSLSYKTCQDNNSRNYPLANLATLNGVTDLAFNSLDGNRDGVSSGPINYFSENDGDTNSRDSYRFSFFTSDQKELSAPTIGAISPSSGSTDILNLSKPVEITFNTLMMASTLKSGSAILGSGDKRVQHKLLNLKTSVETPLGYWIVSTDKDIEPLDGVNDTTVTEIRHSPFAEAVSYGAQVGSGVKDIYQNCFKPSSGPGCQADFENPSCCFGLPTSELGGNGACK